MASSPDSQPETPPTPLESSLVSLDPPVGSPPPLNSSSPPPVDDSPPPPIPASPPPTTTSSPPPVTPASPPPVTSASSPPPSPHVASPPPLPVVASPPPVSLSPPSDTSIPTLSMPTFDSFPPPKNSRTPAPPVNLDPAPVVHGSPPAPVTPSSTILFISPPSGDPSSPPVPPASTTSPSAPSTNTSTSTTTTTSSGSSPRNPLKSGSSSSNAGVSSTLPPPNSPGSSDHPVGTGIAIGVVATVVVIGFMLAILFVQRRRKKRDYNSNYVMPSPYNSSQASGSSLIKANGTGGDFICTTPDNGGLGNSKSWFSYEELSVATNGFSSQNILGAGGFGCVYKGLLQDGREVAVKKLKDNSGQGDREFKAEVEIISRVHHRYLVSLVGYCITDHQRLLVYEFVPNCTLHHHLHSSSKPPMEWPLRVKVACGSARGIAYLHEDCHPRIIHRDIKSPNILIDNNFEAKVADFGLAKLAQDLESNTHISTRVMGTFGYMAPEYASSGKLTEKSDVFSFGVVLLEIITGRKPVDESRPLGDESLVEWARPLMTEALEHGNFDELADPRLQGNYDQGEMFRLIEAAAACVRHSAIKRPKMSQVVRALDTINEISDLSNGMKPGQSGIYDSREQSAQIRLFKRMAFGSQDMGSENFNSSQGSWPSSQVGGRSSLV
ncbi:hypothetical protein RND81_08G220100 [Saponaria officinalis]|uniref:non-specific serine/threonine protein kinase n=1 Tax=Saponaria officinalis TaxID=3572 RepID=A0AAW1JAI6_SAPOF